MCQAGLGADGSFQSGVQPRPQGNSDFGAGLTAGGEQALQASGRGLSQAERP